MLIGGNGVSSGNVFVVNSNGFYGPVCDDGWTDTEATVVCKYEGSLQCSKVYETFSLSLGNLDSTLGPQLSSLTLELYHRPSPWMMSDAMLPTLLSRTALT